MSYRDALSTRELQVFDMIAGGKSPASIADKLGLSVKTVSTYRARIIEKLGIRGGNAGIATVFHGERLRLAEDHALVAAALVAGIARWEPFSGDPAGTTGEVCTCGIRYCTSLDAHGVPILTGLLRDALRINMPDVRKAA